MATLGALVNENETSFVALASVVVCVSLCFWTFSGLSSGPSLFFFDCWACADVGVSPARHTTNPTDKHKAAAKRDERSERKKTGWVVAVVFIVNIK
jgi:hypothetical protein